MSPHHASHHGAHRSRAHVATRVALAVIVAAAGVVSPARPARAAPAKTLCAKPTGNAPYGGEMPWAQQLMNPMQVWPLTTGAGVTVAVLGTGVDRNNGQLAGRLVDGREVVERGDKKNRTVATVSTSALTDCDGRGTLAAGIIAAATRRDTVVAGMAPGARILSVRYTQNLSQGGANDLNPDLIARAIRVAISGGAKVICVLVPASRDSTALRSAVAAAYASGAVLVSAAAPGQGGTNTLSFPTANPDADKVLAVGAINSEGRPINSGAGNNIDVAAPGADLVSTAAGGGKGAIRHFFTFSDPMFAAAYVAGAVALVRSYRPNLSPTQVMQRIKQTANHPPTGTADMSVGAGVINPHLAVSAEGIEAGASGQPDPEAHQFELAVDPPGHQVDRLAVSITVAGLVMALLLVLGTRVFRRGRSRRWRPGLRRVERDGS